MRGGDRVDAPSPSTLKVVTSTAAGAVLEGLLLTRSFELPILNSALIATTRADSRWLREGPQINPISNASGYRLDGLNRAVTLSAAIMIHDRKRALVVFGLATCAFWLSLAVFPGLLPPIGPMPDFSGLVREVAPWIREKFVEQPEGVVLAQLRREFLIDVIKAWLMIAGGTVAGILIVARRAAGRWLAFGLAALVLLIFGSVHAPMVLRDVRHHVQFWGFKLQHLPLLASRDAINVTFSLFTIWFLGRRAAGEAFRRDAPVPPLAT